MKCALVDGNAYGRKQNACYRIYILRDDVPCQADIIARIMRGIVRPGPSTSCHQTTRGVLPVSPLVPLLTRRRVGGVFRSRPDRVPIYSAWTVHTPRSRSDPSQTEASSSTLAALE